MTEGEFEEMMDALDEAEEQFTSGFFDGDLEALCALENPEACEACG